MARATVHSPASDSSDRAAPHCVYQTAGIERYVALAVESAEQWRRLRTVAPLVEFAGPAFDTLAARLTQQEAIDRALRAWTRVQETWGVTRRLQSAGTPAAVVLRLSDLYDDPQLRHREFFVMLEHAEMGMTLYDVLVTQFSATPGTPRRAAHCLGEHTAWVLEQMLGLTPAEIVQDAAASALTWRESHRRSAPLPIHVRLVRTTANAAQAAIDCLLCEHLVNNPHPRRRGPPSPPDQSPLRRRRIIKVVFTYQCNILKEDSLCSKPTSFAQSPKKPA